MLLESNVTREHCVWHEGFNSDMYCQQYMQEWLHYQYQVPIYNAMLGA